MQPRLIHWRFRSHRERALKRGIGFSFTIDEWVKWWEDKLGPNWINKRGPKPNQYCMARYNDIGDYTEDNVKCITNAENRAERKNYLKGSRNHFAKLTKEQVDVIRQSKDHRRLLAQRFGVSEGHISGIKRGAYWKV